MRARNALWIAVLAVGSTGCVAESHVGISSTETLEPSRESPQGVDSRRPSDVHPAPAAAAPNAPVPPSNGAPEERRMNQIAIDPDPKELLGPHNRIVGDIDGDGLDDFFLVAHRAVWTLDADVSRDSAFDGNAAYLFYGKRMLPSDLSTAQADAVFRGEFFDVAPLGDVNGDELADFAIHGVADARIILGSANRFAGELAEDTAGIHWTQQMLPLVIRAPDSMQLQRAGDIDGDGYDDMLVSVVDAYEIVDHGNDSLSGFVEKRLHLVRGRAEAWPSGPFDPRWAAAVFDYPTLGEWQSPYAEALGDVDGDGFDDLRVSVQSDDYVYYGGPDAISGTIREEHAAFSSQVLAFGYTSLLPLGDLDQDGYDDLVTIDEFGALVFYGQAARWTHGDPPRPSLRVERREPGAMPGNIASAIARDVDGDGYTDLIVVDNLRVTRRSDGSVSGADAIYVIAGSGGRTQGVYTVGESDVLAENLFLQVDDLAQYPSFMLLDANGDIDGNGSFDMLVGAQASENHPNSGKVLLFAQMPIEPQ